MPACIAARNGLKEFLDKVNNEGTQVLIMPNESLAMTLRLKMSRSLPFLSSFDFQPSLLKSGIGAAEPATLANQIVNRSVAFGVCSMIVTARMCYAS